MRILQMVGVFSFLILLVVVSLRVAGSPEPSPLALERADNLQATHFGIDRFGNLWWWKRGSRSLQALSPQGEPLPNVAIEGEFPTAVTFDARWGAAGLDKNQDLVLPPAPGDGAPTRLPREEEATHLAWISGGRIAVAPSRAAHRLEIWDSEEHQLIERWGTEEPIPDGPGFHRLRSLLLAWDARQQQLWTLETFTGELVVFSEAGKVLLRRSLEHPMYEETRAWVDERVQEMSANPPEREDTYLNLWRSLTLGPDGAAWILEGCDRATGGSKVLRVSPAGAVDRPRDVLEDCCPSAFTFWGAALVPFKDPRRPGGPSCNGAQQETSR